MNSIDELHREEDAETAGAGTTSIQSGSYLLELSLDWIVLRASQNIHHLLGESHVTLIDEPFGRFVHSQALHDLRNHFSRLSGTPGIGRAYAVRLTDDPDLADIAFQLSRGRVLLEAIPSTGCFGEHFGSVGGLVGGLADNSGQALLDGGARRMRALTGYDRVTLICGDRRAESSRGAFTSPAAVTDDLPKIVANTDAEPVHLFPRDEHESSVDAALLRTAEPSALNALRSSGVRSTLSVAFDCDGLDGEFRCDSRSPREPSFELHAAAELFAQLFSMRLRIDQLRNR